jgi:hypothetical protein
MGVVDKHDVYAPEYVVDGKEGVDAQRPPRPRAGQAEYLRRGRKEKYGCSKSEHKVGGQGNGAGRGGKAVVL